MKTKLLALLVFGALLLSQALMRATIAANNLPAGGAPIVKIYDPGPYAPNATTKRKNQIVPPKSRRRLTA